MCLALRRIVLAAMTEPSGPCASGRCISARGAQGNVCVTEMSLKSFWSKAQSPRGPQTKAWSGALQGGGPCAPEVHVGPAWTSRRPVTGCVCVCVCGDVVARGGGGCSLGQVR